MKTISYKKFTISILAICLFFIIIWAAIVYLVDPFYHYHAPYFGLQPIANKQEYQTLGMARNFEYDSVLVGSSMTENFKASWFDEAYGGHTLKLSYQLGRMDNYDLIFKNIFSTHKIKNVFFGLDMNAVGQAPWQVSLHEIPDYLSDDSLLNDTNYLFNKDVMFRYVREYLSKNIKKQVPDFDNSYCWDQKTIYSKQAVLTPYKTVRPVAYKPSAFDEQWAVENMKIITKYIEQNPETQFYIFYPPFGILVYDSAIIKGDYPNIIKNLKYAAEVLLQYDNVKLYLFQNMQDIITNLDLYKDTAHYSPQVNKEMLEAMKKEEYRLTKENYEKEFENMNQFFLNYNYDTIFE